MNHKNGGNNVLLILQNDKIFPVEANEHSIAFPIRRYIIMRLWRIKSNISLNDVITYVIQKTLVIESVEL